MRAASARPWISRAVRARRRECRAKQVGDRVRPNLIAVNSGVIAKSYYTASAFHILQGIVRWSFATLVRSEGKCSRRCDAARALACWTCEHRTRASHVQNRAVARLGNAYGCRPGHCRRLPRIHERGFNRVPSQRVADANRASAWKKHDCGSRTRHDVRSVCRRTGAVRTRRARRPATPRADGCGRVHRRRPRADVGSVPAGVPAAPRHSSKQHRERVGPGVDRVVCAEPAVVHGHRGEHGRARL
jgi:hypothetical protein